VVQQRHAFFAASLSTRYCTARVDKRARSASLYHFRHCGDVLKPRSDGI